MSNDYMGGKTKQQKKGGANRNNKRISLYISYLQKEQYSLAIQSLYHELGNKIPVERERGNILLQCEMLKRPKLAS